MRRFCGVWCVQRPPEGIRQFNRSKIDIYNHIKHAECIYVTSCRFLWLIGSVLGCSSDPKTQCRFFSFFRLLWLFYWCLLDVVAQPHLEVWELKANCGHFSPFSFFSPFSKLLFMLKGPTLKMTIMEIVTELLTILSQPLANSFSEKPWADPNGNQWFYTFSATQKVVNKF